MTDFNNLFGGTQAFSDTAAQINLGISTVLTYTVPGLSTQKYSARFIFPSGSSVYIGLNTTPVIAATGAITSSPNVAFNPVNTLYVKGGDILSFISRAAVTDGLVSLLKIPS